MNEQVKVEPKPIQAPFFVRFLEQQQALVVQSDVKAGGNRNVTMKYPSDGDEASPI